MLFCSVLYNLDRDRQLEALHAVMPYRPEHFSPLGHVAISYRGRTQHSALQLKPRHARLWPGTCVAEVDFGLAMDPQKFRIKRLGRVVSSKVRLSRVRWATRYETNADGVEVVRHDPPREEEANNLWLAELIGYGPVNSDQALADFGPLLPPAPPKKRKAPTLSPKTTKKARRE